MAYQTKDLTGALWKNDRQREGKKDPDYTGSAKIRGEEFWVDSWINNNPRHEDYDPQKKTFLSLSFRPKQPKADAPDPKKKQYDLNKNRPVPPPPRPPVDPDLDGEEPDQPF